MLPTRTQDSCGPSGCLIDPLDQRPDPASTTTRSRSTSSPSTAGWGDGLPLLPPTEPRVRGDPRVDPVPHRRRDRDPPADEPRGHRRAGRGQRGDGRVRAGGIPYVIAALEAMCEPSFNLDGVTTTTSSVFPMLIVNGPSRDRVGIDYRTGCMGGAGRARFDDDRARGVAVPAQHRRPEGGRDVEERVRPTRSARGVLRRVGGAVAVAVAGRAVGVLVTTTTSSPCTRAKGTHPFADINNDDPRDLLYLIAKTRRSRCRTSSSRRRRATARPCSRSTPSGPSASGRRSPTSTTSRRTSRHAWQPIELWPAAEPGRARGEGPRRRRRAACASTSVPTSSW